MKTYILRDPKSVERQNRAPSPVCAARCRLAAAGARWPPDVLKLIKKLRTAHAGASLKFCYEAGPRGYPLGRFIRSHQAECILVAPSKVPRKPGAGKTAWRPAHLRWLGTVKLPFAQQQFAFQEMIGTTPVASPGCSCSE